MFTAKKNLTNLGYANLEKKKKKKDSRVIAKEDERTIFTTESINEKAISQMFNRVR